MAWTQADIDAHKAAIGRGVLRVTQGDETIEYRDLAEMMAILRLMEKELGVAGQRGITVSYPLTSRGL